MYRVKEYITEQGRNPFQRWFRKLTADQGDRVNTALSRMITGQLQDTKHVGNGVYELRLHMGPGFRIYYGHDGKELIVLLIGGDKSSQRRNIDQAQRFWRDYRERKSHNAKR